MTSRVAHQQASCSGQLEAVSRRCCRCTSGAFFASRILGRGPTLQRQLPCLSEVAPFHLLPSDS